MGDDLNCLEPMLNAHPSTDDTQNLLSGYQIHLPREHISRQTCEFDKKTLVIFLSFIPLAITREGSRQVVGVAFDMTHSYQFVVLDAQARHVVGPFSQPSLFDALSFGYRARPKDIRIDFCPCEVHLPDPFHYQPSRITLYNTQTGDSCYAKAIGRDPSTGKLLFLRSELKHRRISFTAFLPISIDTDPVLMYGLNALQRVKRETDGLVKEEQLEGWTKNKPTKFDV